FSRDWSSDVCSSDLGGHAGRPNQPQPEPNMIRFAEASADEPPILADASDTERLGDEIAELAAHIHAATHRLLTLLAEFDAREGRSEERRVGKAATSV